MPQYPVKIGINDGVHGPIQKIFGKSRLSHPPGLQAHGGPTGGRMSPFSALGVASQTVVRRVNVSLSLNENESGLNCKNTESVAIKRELMSRTYTWIFEMSIGDTYLADDLRTPPDQSQNNPFIINGVSVLCQSLCTSFQSLSGQNHPQKLAKTHW